MTKLELTSMDGGGACTLSELLRRAKLSCRMCVSEGRTGVASDVLVCVACGGSVSAECKGWPEHAKLVPFTEKRLPPSDFESALKAILPMCFRLSGVDDLAAARPNGALIGKFSGGGAGGDKSAKAKAKAAERAAEAEAEARRPRRRLRRRPRRQRPRRSHPQRSRSR